MTGPLAALLVGLVRLDSTLACPSEGEVAERLRPLLAEAPAIRPPDLVVLDELGGRLRLRLYGPDRALLSERQLEPGPCSELAAAAAVVIATWEGEPRSAPTPLLAPAVARTIAPGPDRALELDVSASLLGSLADGQPTLGGALGTTVLSRAAHLGGRIEVAGFGLRAINLGPGQLAWARAWASLGVDYRHARGALMVDAHVEFLAALVSLQGRGLAVGRSVVDFDPGVGAGVRLSLRRGRWAGHLSLAVAGWPRAQLATVDNASASATLPRLEVLLGLGVGVGSYGP